MAENTEYMVASDAKVGDTVYVDLKTRSPDFSSFMHSAYIVGESIWDNGREKWEVILNSNDNVILSLRKDYVYKKR